MPVTTVQDVELAEQLTAVHARFNAESTLRLYTNTPVITTAMNAGHFTEATFAGYEAVDLAGLWSEPEQDEAGAWVMVTQFLTFAIDPEEDGPTSQDIEGLWVEQGDTVRFAGPLAATFPLEAGGQSLSFRVEVPLMDALTAVRRVFP